MKNIFLLFPLLLIISCANNELSLFSNSVQAEVQQCGNIWQDFKTADNLHQEAVADFLEMNDIKFTDLEEVNTNVIALCTFCFPCPAGKDVTFKVKNKDLETILALGFIEN